MSAPIHIATAGKVTTAATDSGSELGWLLAGPPSARETAPAVLSRLGRIQAMGDAATRDPAAFVKALFDAVDYAVSDAAGDAREAESYRQSPEAHFGVGPFRP